MYIQKNCHSSLVLNKIIYFKMRSFNLSNFSLQKYQHMHRCIKILNVVRKNDILSNIQDKIDTKLSKKFVI